MSLLLILLLVVLAVSSAGVASAAISAVGAVGVAGSCVVAMAPALALISCVSPAAVPGAVVAWAGTVLLTITAVHCRVGPLWPKVRATLACSDSVRASELTSLV